MDATMFQLRSFVHQRLYTAAEEILGEVEKTITLALYKAEVSRSKEEVESLRRQLGLLRKKSVEPPQISVAVEYKDKWDSALVQKNPGPSPPQESSISAGAEVPGPSESSADLDLNTWNYCLDDVLQMSDMKEEQGQTVNEKQTQGTGFAPPELVKCEQETRVSYESPAAWNESDSEEDLVHSRTNQTETVRMKAKMGQSGNGSEKMQVVLASKNCSPKCPKDRSFCHVCGKGFQYVGSLMKHIKTHERTTDCTICGITFQATRDLISHLQGCHKKIYFCSICGKTFASSRCLRLHEKIHKVVKEFECQECGRAFNRREHLIVHVRTHSGEKPYHCDICGKAFSQSQNLTIHKRGHSGEKPYHCVLCGKLFNTSSHLKTHMRYHSGEKPYQCDICGKRFRQSGQMTRHRTTHTGERPYACPLCGMRYRFAPNLKVHMKTHEKAAANDNG
ncbi:zinc finger protein OZF-like [Betta splendens]|uniref:Zinc finger protein OZF-like n=1 Tax=Betta splendens TaxID=158456 RepID=A0A6P7N9V6_BETSP|nr:zinc finger protein OZF-like [Betta splendens]